MRAGRLVSYGMRRVAGAARRGQQYDPVRLHLAIQREIVRLALRPPFAMQHGVPDAAAAHIGFGSAGMIRCMPSVHHRR